MGFRINSKAAITASILVAALALLAWWIFPQRQAVPEAFRSDTQTKGKTGVQTKATFVSEGTQQNPDKENPSVTLPVSAINNTNQPTPVWKRTHLGLPPEPIRTYLPALEKAINDGDGDAAYHLFSAYRTCKNAPPDMQAVTLGLANIAKAEQLTESQKQNEAAKLQEQFQHCDGFKPQDIFSPRAKALIIQAANAGHPMAKIEYGGFAAPEIDETLPTDLQMIRHAEALVEYKQETMRHLREAVAMGFPAAMVNLGFAYMDGILVEQDLIEAYAYLSTADANSNTPRLADIINQLAASMTPEQIERAISKGRDYEKQCCEGK